MKELEELRSVWAKIFGEPATSQLVKAFESNDLELAFKALVPIIEQAKADPGFKQHVRQVTDKQRFGRVDAIAEMIRTIVFDHPLSGAEINRLIAHVRSLPIRPDSPEPNVQPEVKNLYVLFVKAGLPKEMAHEWAELWVGLSKRQTIVDKKP